MGKMEYVEILNNKLIQIGEELRENGQSETEDLRSPGEKITDVIVEAEETGVYLPYQQLCETLGLTDYEKILLCLLWNSKEKTSLGVSFSYVKKRLQPYEDFREKSPLAPCFWLEQGEILLSHVTYAFLQGELPNLGRYIQIFLGKEETFYGKQQLLLPGKKILDAPSRENKEPLALVLSGESGSGRHFLARQLAAAYNMNLIQITPQGVLEEREINEILLAAELYQGLLCVDALTKTPEELLKNLAGFVPFLLVIKDKNHAIHEDVGYGLNTQIIQQPDTTLKKEIIADLLLNGEEKINIPQGVTPEMLASKQMPLGMFIRYIKNIKTELEYGTFDIEKNLYGTGLGNLDLLPANRTLEELKLPDIQLQQLKKICQIIASRKQVLEQWGFGRKFSYGNGVSVLFYGAPGTGKTMAAQVLANELGMPLFRVDLSQLISKYIGETQKNIGRIFEEAEKSDCILLFDEADAIFAKRSDVSDAQDRYSNAETAYLLQRIEQYEGVSILATNLLQNFDDAFRRRITYMLHFPVPDAHLRQQLWSTMLPEEAQVSQEVDYELLAQTFELSGASIKNAVIHGASCAMAEKTAVSMYHLLDGIQNEYTKIGKNFNQSQMELMNAYL